MNINIIDYEDRHAEAFRKLNAEWLLQYGLMESHDLEVLNDPRATILDGGGCIFLAESDGSIVGSSGLIYMGEKTYELVKMGVQPDFRGRGISKMLIEKCLEKAKETGATKIILYSNSQLGTALKLYEKYGFRHVPVIDAPFVTADVKMELLF
jgi:putative acetyltransferase